MRPPTRVRSARAAALLVAAAASGCVVEAPPGPTTVLVSVAPWPQFGPDPRASLEAALGSAVELPTTFAAGDPWTALVDLCASGAVDPRWVERAHLPGTATTLAETLLQEGFETGAFLSGATFDETSGVLQGFLHLDEPFVRAASGADPGPAGAALAAAQYCRLKIPRPLEDSAFAWLHLDLADEPDRAAALASALTELAGGLAEDPDAVVVLASLDPSGPGARLALHADGPVPPAPASAADFPTYLREVMRAADGAGARGEQR